MFPPRVANINILLMLLANYNKQYKYPTGYVCTELLQLLLVISGNEELNLGLQTPKYPCGDCGKVVAINSTACDICNSWCHCQCAGINLTIFESYIKNSKMEWEHAQYHLVTHPVLIQMK